jgi:ABC-type glycerol-3-phosphate transport system substrate-binding protein
VSNDHEQVLEAAEHGEIDRAELLRRAAALGVSLTAFGGIAGAVTGSAGAATQAITLRYQKGPHIANDLEVQNRYSKVYTAKRPNVTIKNELYDWGQMATQLTTEFASSPPDITYEVDIVYPTFAKAGALVDLTSRVRAKSYASEFRQYYPNFWKVGTYGGKVWGVPYLNAPTFIFVNLDLLAKAGVGATEWQSSYAAMRAAAKKMTGGGAYGFSLRSTQLQDVPFLDWMVYVNNAGAGIMNKTKTKGGLDTPAMAQAQQALGDIYGTDRSAPPAGAYDQNGLRALFTAGRIGLLHNSSDFVLALQEKDPGFKWGIAMAPPGPAGRTVFGNTGILTISKKSSNPNAAWDYVKFLSSKKLAAGYMGQTKFATVRKDSARLLWRDNAVMKRVQTDFVAREVPFQTHPRLGEMLTKVWDHVLASLDGKATGAQAMKGASADVTAILQAKS